MMKASGTELGTTLDEENGIADIDMAQLYELIPMLSVLPEGSMEPYIEQAAGTDSVSYTHLDVYKRQNLYCGSKDNGHIAESLLGWLCHGR